MARDHSTTPTDIARHRAGDQLFPSRRVVSDRDRDAALVAECLRGRQGAMAILVGHYEKPVFNAAYRVLGDMDDAADVTQTVFLKVFENLASFDPDYKFFSWIYRIAVNEAVSALKRRPPARVPLEDISVTSRSAEQSAEEQNLGRRVQQVLMKMPDEQRVLIALKHFSELSYREIGAILEIPEKTVKSRLYSARQQMKKALEDEGITTP